MSRNQLSLSSILALSQAIILNQGESGQMMLTSLSLERNKMGPQAAKLLVESLREHGGLKDLQLSHNFIGNEGCLQLASLLQKRKNKLVKMDISYNKITGDGVVPLFNSITKRKGQKPCTLKCLKLDGNKIFTHRDAQEFLLRLLESNSMQDLSLSGSEDLQNEFLMSIGSLLKNSRLQFKISNLTAK